MPSLHDLSHLEIMYGHIIVEPMIIKSPSILIFMVE